MAQSWPKLGVGVGLRSQHYPFIFEQKPNVDWFEVVSENYMDSGGQPRHALLKIRENYPIVMHGVSMSIGSTDPLDLTYLKKLKVLAADVEPELISDHLCWTGVNGIRLHDLLPLPYTEDALQWVVDRVTRVQDILKRPLVLENVSSYVEFDSSELSESTFLAEVSKQSGCGILLDVNNVHVSCYNHRLNASDYIKDIPMESVAYIHLAGHRIRRDPLGDFLFDTHSDHVIPEVWGLYSDVLKQKPSVSTLIEWDEDIPEFPILLNERDKALSLRESRP